MFAHQCDMTFRVPRHHEIQIIYYPEHGVWMLQAAVIANEQAVYDGQAQTIGDIISAYRFTIHFCPFCGMKLAPTT